MISARFIPILVVAAMLRPQPVRAEDPSREIETCLGCHGDKTMSVELPDGKSVSLYVDRAALAGSIHGKDLRCTDCHAGMGDLPHAERNVKTLEAFQSGFRDACKPCHFDTYTQSLDGVHYKQLAKGNASAPWCTDCHGAHDVAPASSPRTRVSETCAACHQEVAEIYMGSVHGKALAAGNADVPVCSDCHRAHDISDPRTESWLVKSPEICARCHADKAKMAKYGLSTDVVRTYLSDFHGVTASMTKARGSEALGGTKVTALCIDCHGVHDVTATKDANSQVLKANLVKTCRKCHANASESFPSAWLSHYEPSWSRAPLVHGVKVFYMILIPFMIGGLVLQVLLHLWRVVVNR
jgi:predicted CXXCH cytochrome family protein